ncbi:hypothetical protein RN001_009226 [Aquatica leii]|uniref:Exonuclease domain-containing protein n=1 Tax=Aquatica leii TaxID=1421715 RepID=A0AAN7SPU0_9COLE|nr:hypothetical protein RN001_009226 [Aquatica leii]
MQIQTFVFLDSETTGLPHQENNETRVTELCLIAVQSDHLVNGVYSRIQNKLSLCFNPCKAIDPQARKITGLSNQLLKFQPNFDYISYNLIQTFLSVQKKPVCLVAHNGNQFDYPILKAEIYKTENELFNDLLSVDTIVGFRQLLSNKYKPVQPAQPQVPIEFQDGFNEILLEIVERFESSTDAPFDNDQTITETDCIPAAKKKLNDSSPMDVPKRRKLFGSPPSFTLSNLYNHLTKKTLINAHRAESDVLMLMECAATLGQEFVDWCNSNAQKFSDVPMMMPGRKIGT